MQHYYYSYSDSGLLIQFGTSWLQKLDVYCAGNRSTMHIPILAARLVHICLCVGEVLCRTPVGVELPVMGL